MLDAETERALLKRIREENDQRAAAQLLSAHLRLVLKIASKYSRNGVAFDDLVAEGNLGLVLALQRYDGGKAGTARFATYATWWITAYIRRFAIANRRIVRPPGSRDGRRLFYQLRRVERQLQNELGRAPTRAELADYFNVTVSDVERIELVLGTCDASIESAFEDGPMDIPCARSSPEALASSNQLVEKALQLAKLSDREREILDRHFVSDEDETLETIGEVLGISRERVRQIETAAIGKVRKALGVK